MAHAEEEHVHLVQRQLVGKTKVGVANQSLMHVNQRMTGMARRMDKGQRSLRMMNQQAAEFARRIAGTANNSYFNLLVHRLLSFSSLWLA